MGSAREEKRNGEILLGRRGSTDCRSAASRKPRDSARDARCGGGRAVSAGSLRRAQTHADSQVAIDGPRAPPLRESRFPSIAPRRAFAGAVGSGFSLTVSADRTVVKVGEPIALHFELRGDGNLETAALPRLDAKGLLPPTSFRVADGEIPGRLRGRYVKRFTAMVRGAGSQTFNEIPALEYSWFDPTTETVSKARIRARSRCRLAMRR